MINIIFNYIFGLILSPSIRGEGVHTIPFLKKCAQKRKKKRTHAPMSRIDPPKVCGFSLLMSIYDSDMLVSISVTFLSKIKHLHIKHKKKITITRYIRNYHT